MGRKVKKTSEICSPNQQAITSALDSNGEPPCYSMVWFSVALGVHIRVKVLCLCECSLKRSLKDTRPAKNNANT